MAGFLWRFANRRTGIAETTLRQLTQFVMPGLVPGMTVFKTALRKRTRMAGTFGAKTRFAPLPGHDPNQQLIHGPVRETIDL
jgi:hypothetical protein